MVTGGTVKTHIHNMCGKIGVGSRKQAIARARDLNRIYASESSSLFIHLLD